MTNAIVRRVSIIAAIFFFAASSFSIYTAYQFQSTAQGAIACLMLMFGIDNVIRAKRFKD